VLLLAPGQLRVLTVAFVGGPTSGDRPDTKRTPFLLRMISANLVPGGGGGGGEGAGELRYAAGGGGSGGEGAGAGAESSCRSYAVTYTDVETTEAALAAPEAQAWLAGA
jgi:hypothetical protein